LCRELREQETREGFRDRSYFEDRVLARSAVGEYTALAMIDYANRHSATGRFPEQAVLDDGCELGVESMPQIGERDRRLRRQLGCLGRR
jgi:hypothetical protein